MTIKPTDAIGSWKTATVKGYTPKQLAKVLGFPPNVDDDPDKVKHSWAFEVDGVACAVWDYKGSQREREYSAWGPIAALKKVFGDNVEGEDLRL